MIGVLWLYTDEVCPKTELGFSSSRELTMPTSQVTARSLAPRRLRSRCLIRCNLWSTPNKGPTRERHCSRWSMTTLRKSMRSRLVGSRSRARLYFVALIDLPLGNHRQTTTLLDFCVTAPIASKVHRHEYGAVDYRPSDPCSRRIGCCLLSVSRSLL